jgi:hypothetical protein
VPLGVVGCNRYVEPGDGLPKAQDS